MTESAVTLELAERIQRSTFQSLSQDVVQTCPPRRVLQHARRFARIDVAHCPERGQRHPRARYGWRAHGLWPRAETAAVTLDKSIDAMDFARAQSTVRVKTGHRGVLGENRFEAPGNMGQPPFAGGTRGEVRRVRGPCWAGQALRLSAAREPSLLANRK